MAPVIMGNPDRPELGEELTNSFCRTDPEIASALRARHLPLRQPRRPRRACTTPTLVLQCASDVIAPQAVGEFVHRQHAGQPARAARRDGPLPEPERARRRRSPPSRRSSRRVRRARGGTCRRRAPRTSTRTRPAATSRRCPTATIVKVNETFLRWTGYRRDDLVGAPPLPGPADARAGRIYHETHIAPLLQMQGAVREIALEVVCADGRRLPVLVNSVLKRDADGEPAARPHHGLRRDGPQAVRARAAARARPRARRARADRAAAAGHGRARRRALDARGRSGAAIVARARASTGAGARSSPCSTSASGCEIVPRAASTLGGGGLASRRARRAARRRRSSPRSRLRSATDGSERWPRCRSWTAARAACSGSGSPARASSPTDERAFMAACAGQCAQALERAHAARAHGRAARGARPSTREASRALDEVQDSRARAAARRARRARGPAPGSSCSRRRPAATPGSTVATRATAAAGRAERRARAPRRGSGRSASRARRELARRPARARSLRRPAAARPRPGARRADLARFDPSAASARATCRSCAELADRAGARARERAALRAASATSPTCCSRPCSPGTPPRDARFEVAT